MISTTDNEKKIQCPYDKAHQILHYRFQSHLTRCRRNFPNFKSVPCLYNATHIVPEPELNYHMETCVDRVGIDQFMYVAEHTVPSAPPLQKINISSHENWDDDCNHETYNAIEQSKTKAIIRTSNQTLSAAQRRKFRQEERARHNLVANNDQFRETVRHNNSEVPLRRPHEQSSSVQIDTDDLLKQIKKGANVVNTPRIGPNTSHFEQLDFSDAVVLDAPSTSFAGNIREDFPPLAPVQSQPRDGVWNASSLAESFKPKSRGRGRNLQK